MKDEPNKNNLASYLMILLAIVIIVLVLFVGFEVSSLKSSGINSSTAGSTTTIKMNALTISASGSVSNSATEGMLYVDINATGQTNQLAVENISTTLNVFNSTVLKYINGNLSDISTSYFNSYKIYNKSGYEATESLMLTIPNIKNTSSVIGALSAIPNVYVTSTAAQLSNSQVSAMRIEALSLALANATSQARALIGTNNTIYSTNISVNNYYVYPIRYGLASGVPSNVSPASGITTTVTPNFYSGTADVTESITVVFNWGSKQ